MQRPTVVPSEDEVAFIDQILEHTNSQHNGYLLPPTAIDIFNRSGLSRLELRDIWKLSDADSNGKLTKEELAVAIRLMGWMQSGRPFSESLLEKPGPLPTIEGIPQLRPQNNSFPPVLSKDIQEFQKVYKDARPVDGHLDGDRVRDVFLRYNLSFQDLSAIWVLIDPRTRGRLDFNQFSLGLYLIQAITSCRLQSVPAAVPPEIRSQLEEMCRAIMAELDSPFLAPGEAPSLPPPVPTRAPPPPPGKSPKVPPKPPPIKPKPALKPWMISAREKGESDRAFTDLDVDGLGQISTDTAAGYLRQYRLPEGDLAHIMRISSIRNEPHLMSEEFAVANHLASAAAKGKPLPSELPISLVPPVLRTMSSPLTSPQLPSPPPKPAYADTEATTPTTSLYSHSASASVSSLTFLTENPAAKRYIPPNSDHLARRMSSSYSSSSASTPLSEDREDPLEELKTETKTLRRQIDNLLSQLSSQNDLRNQNDELREENAQLKSKVADLEASIATVLTQMQNNDNALSEELTKEIERLARRVAELEQTEHQLQQTVGILEVAKRDNANFAGQLRDLRTTEANLKTELDDAKHAMDDLEKENTELKQRLADMTKVLSGPAGAKGDNVKELRMLLADITKENQSLKSKVRDVERSMEQLLLSSRNTTEIDELRRQNRELQMQVQELEQIAAHLQSSQEDNQLQQVLLVVTRENEGMKVRIREMQASSTQARTDHDRRMAEMQRRIDELAAENTRLKTEAETSARSRARDSMDVPPPAYDDSFIPDDIR